MIEPFSIPVADWPKLVGMHVFYQQPHMKWPEYGYITSIQSMPLYVHVRFNFDTVSKAVRPQDLHWPPDFCEQDRCNPPGQIFGVATDDDLRRIGATSESAAVIANLVAALPVGGES
jgi:hypothetical protein